MSTKLKILQIGAGSMGTRRMRDMSARGDIELAIFDQRADRRAIATERFGAVPFATIESAMQWGPEALTISTPPDAHEPYVRLALDRGLHSFSEANIWTYDPSQVERATIRHRIVTAASCSMRFLPSVKKLRELVDNELGDLVHYHMTLAFTAADWHPSEGNEYYARHPATAPAREMLAFEAEYLNYLFGEPESVAGSVTRRADHPGHPHDTWTLQARLVRGGTASFFSTMASPVDNRAGEAIGLGGRLSWNIMTGDVRFTSAGSRTTQEFATGRMLDVLEGAYDEEIGTFVEAVRGRVAWPYSYRDNSVATAMIAAVERSQITGRWERVDGQPAKVFQVA